MNANSKSVKLSRTEVATRFGAKAVAALPSGIWRDGSNTLPLEAVAQLTGCDSGEALLLALSQARMMPPEQAIEILAEAEMARRYGDAAGELPGRAARALANERQAQVLAMQLRIVERLAAGSDAEVYAIDTEGEDTAAADEDVVTDLAALTAQAHSFIARRKVADLESIERYQANGARLVEKLEQALAEKDYVHAAKLAQQRLFNFLLLRAAFQAAEEVASGLRMLQSLDKARLLGNTPQHWAHIQDLLVNHTLLDDGEKSGEFVEREGFAAWLEAQRSIGCAPFVARSVLERSEKTSWRDLSLTDFKDLQETIQSIAHVAQKDRGESERALAALQILPPLYGAIAPKELITDWNATLVDRPALQHKMEEYAQAGGEFFRQLFGEVEEAHGRCAARRHTESETLEKILRDHYGEEAASVGQRQSAVFVGELGASFTLEERLCVALNSACAANYQSLVMDRRLGGAGGVDAILATLAKRDWDCAKALWKEVARWLPALRRSHEARLGVALRAVEPFEMPGEHVRRIGGFWPLAFSGQSEGETETFFGLLNGDVTNACGVAGQQALQAKNQGGEVLLSFSVLADFIERSLIELELAPSLRAAWLLATEPKVSSLIESRLGAVVMHQTGMYLKRLATGSLLSVPLFDLLSGLYHPLGRASPGWKLAQKLLESSSFANISVRITAASMLNGLMHLGRKAGDVAWGVRALSPIMERRLQTWKSDAPKMGASFWAQLKSRQLVELPIWLAAYSGAIADGKTEREAVSAGDALIEACNWNACRMDKEWNDFVRFVARHLDLQQAEEIEGLTRDETAADCFTRFIMLPLLTEIALRELTPVAPGQAFLSRNATAAVHLQKQVAAALPGSSSAQGMADDTAHENRRQAWMLSEHRMLPIRLSKMQINALHHRQI